MQLMIEDIKIEDINLKLVIKQQLQVVIAAVVLKAFTKFPGKDMCLGPLE